MNRALMFAPVLLALSMAPALAQSDGCFRSQDMDSWRAQDSKTVFIRVEPGRRYFRLDLAAMCPQITHKGVHLITETRGSGQICSAVDWDLKVSENGPGAIPIPCIVKTMTALSPVEAGAIPKEFKP